ncbi:O-antigen ligase family protein, partial [Paenibacillus puldeungensis]
LRGAAVLAAAALLPATLLACAGSLGRWLRPGTGYARAALYRDGAALLRDAPWLGRGGDTWRHAFHRIQHGPYVGSEVHSGYLDIALDLGLIGLAVLILWLGYIVIRMYRLRSAMLPPTIVLLLHSAVDFDMSYGLVWLLLLWLAVAAAGAGGLRNIEAETANIAEPTESADIVAPTIVKQAEFTGIVEPTEPADAAEVLGKLLLNTERDALSTSGHTPHTPAHSQALTRTPRLVLACVAALLLAAGAVGFRQAESLKYYRKAVSAASISDTALPTPTVQATAWLERSLAYSPYRPSARLALAALSAPADAAPQLRVGLVYDPAHPGLWLALGDALAQLEDPAAIPALQRALELDRFDRAQQTAVLRSIVLLAQHLQSQGRLREAQVAVATGEAAFSRYEQLVMQVALTDGRNDRQFHMTVEAEALGDKLKQIRKSVTATADAHPQSAARTGSSR